MEIKREIVYARAPASVANVGVGFDVMGLAIDGLYDKVGVRANKTGKVAILKIEGDDGKLPLASDKNVASHVVGEFLKKIDSTVGVDVFLEKGVPLSSGLGSSAASACAAVVAVNALFGEPFAKEDLIGLAMQGEILVSGAAHADNVAPSLLGGLILIPSVDPLDVIKLPYNGELTCIVVHPRIEINTIDARAILPENINLRQAVKQWGGLAGFVASLYRGDFGKLGHYLQDFIIEPVRKGLIPGFSDVKQAAIKAGAIACSISGSGPTLFALTLDHDKAPGIAEAMKEAFGRVDLQSTTHISKINREGTQVITNETI